MNHVWTTVNLAFFAVILIMFVLLLINAMKKGIDLFGKPPIHRLAFVCGKIGNFACWALYGYALARSIAAPSGHPAFLRAASAVTVCAAAVFVVGSFRKLGDLNRFGLPSEKTELVREGIYAHSRNPMYVGFDLLNVSSILFFPVAVNLVLGVTGMVVHHFIILAEEKYMLAEFGDSWRQYAKEVRRYL